MDIHSATISAHTFGFPAVFLASATHSFSYGFFHKMLTRNSAMNLAQRNANFSWSIDGWSAFSLVSRRYFALLPPVHYCIPQHQMKRLYERDSRNPRPRWPNIWANPQQNDVSASLVLTTSHFASCPATRSTGVVGFPTWPHSPSRHQRLALSSLLPLVHWLGVTP